MKEYLLVGTYTTNDAPGCTADTVCGKGVYCFSYNSDKGQIGEMTDLLEMESPSYLTVDQAGGILFAVNETMKASVSCLCELKNGKLSEKYRLSVSGAAACHVAYEEKRKLLAVSNYMSGSLGLVSVQQNEKLERRLQIWYQGRGFHQERQDMSHVHSCLFYRDYLLVADLGLDQIHVYRMVDDETEFLEDLKTRPGSGPRHMVVYEDSAGSWLYVVNELSCDVSVYRFRPGGFEEVQREPLYEGMLKDGSLAADIHITKNGILYASIRGEDRILWYQIRNGRLFSAGSMGSGGKGPRSFCFDREERHLIVANQLTSELVVFPMEKGIVKADCGRHFPVPVPVKVLTVVEERDF